MRFYIFTALAIILAIFTISSDAAFVSALVVYSSMQPTCAKAAMACYAAGGATWVATLGLTAPPTIVACNAGFGTCQATAAKLAYIASWIPFL